MLVAFISRTFKSVRFQPLSGSVLAMPVRFHFGSVPSRFGSNRFPVRFQPLSGSVPVRFHYGSVLVGTVLAIPVRFRGHLSHTKSI